MMNVKTENLKVKDIDSSSKDFTLDPSPFSISSSYDDWAMIAEICTGDSQVSPSTNYYTWGLDLSGSLQGAGGIGGLLSTVQDGDIYFSCFDANGNITEYVDETGDIVAHYEYNPFGGITSAIGDKKDDFNFRFSTKYLTETGLYYYGYRSYLPELGRWLRRDPMENLAFVVFDDIEDITSFDGIDFSLFTSLTQDESLINNLLFVDNNSVNYIDVLGLASPEAPSWAPWQKCTLPKVWKKKPGGIEWVGDGCSAPAAVPGPPDNPTKKCSFRKACNGHDSCYSDCSKPKSSCDTGFKANLNKACFDCGKGYSGKEKKIFLKSCYYWTSKFHWAVKTSGKAAKGYEDRQKNNCDCVCP